jgi:hypothetical protein
MRIMSAGFIAADPIIAKTARQWDGDRPRRISFPRRVPVRSSARNPRIRGAGGDHRSLKALLCANDNMAIGAAAAVAAAGKTHSVLITGFDDIAAIKPLLAGSAVSWAPGAQNC